VPHVTLVQLARVLVSDDGVAHVIDVGLPEGSEAIVASITERLRTALDAIGAQRVRFEVRRSAELPRGRARVMRLLPAGATISAALSERSATTLLPSTAAQRAALSDAVR
jgi:hypothetical protein